MTLAEYLGAMFGTRTIEIAASLCGLANVWLIILRSLWNYPFGLVMVTLYAWIFYGAKLYSDALLQLFFFAVQILGLYWWIVGRSPEGDLIIRRLSMRQAGAVLGFAALATGGWGWIMASYTDAALPWWDSAIAVLSLSAQWLLSRRFLENWVLWISVDVLAIWVYLAKDLQPTAVLYAIFLVLAIIGALDWWRSWRRQGNGT